MTSDDMERWRGQIEERVRQNASKIGDLNGDLRAINTTLIEMRREMTAMQGELREAREDIAEASETFNKSREHEVDELRVSLKEAIAEHSMTKRDIAFRVVAPIVVAIFVALLIYAITGHVTG